MSVKTDYSTVERALLLLETLLQHPHGIEVSQLLARTDASRSSLFVLLQTLRQMGYIEQSEKRGRYRAGPRLLAWRGGSSLDADLQIAFHQEASAAALPETLFLALPAEGGALLIAQVEGSAQVRSTYPVGMSFPPHSAVSQVLLGSPPSAVGQTGYAVTMHEESLDLALPICRDGQTPVAALGLSSPRFRWSTTREEEYLPRLREMAARLSYRLGAMRYAPWKSSAEDTPIERRPLDSGQVRAFLAAPWVARLACLRPDGTPHVVPVWQEWDGQYFYVTAWQGSLWAEYLLSNANVSLTIDEPWPPLRRVLARGHSIPLADADLPGGLNALLDRLRRRYLGASSSLPAADWQAFRIIPHTFTAWQGLM